ncbi:MAG: carboxypeptidase-like regulatory domain-containing protein [Chitinophagaceae bacterium]
MTTLLVVFCTLHSRAQHIGYLEGRILDKEKKTVAGAAIARSGRTTGVVSNDSGYFTLQIPSGIMVTVEFSGLNHKTEKRRYQLNKNQHRHVTIVLESEIKQLRNVKVQDSRIRTQPGTIHVDPKKSKINPSPIGGIEGLIKTLVGSNNELTSQYNVRGGNYDENLVYVNDYEIYRPFLIQNAQSEGLSFINADLAENVRFSMGGFQAKYGDKMSSVLDVTYKHPDTAAGSAYIGMLEQGLHLEGVSRNKKFTYLFGLRNRTNRNITSSQATDGNYIPSSSDVQGLFTYDAGNDWRFELLGNYNRTKFTFFPQSLQLTTSVLSPLYTADINANFTFEGSEKDKYTTNFVGLAAMKQVSKNVQLKWLFSHYGDREAQNSDIAATYSLDAGENGESSILGQGSNINYSRNSLKIDLWTAQHKGSWRTGKHFLQWGLLLERQSVNSKINQWTYLDSAGYALPNTNGDELVLNDWMLDDSRFSLARTTGFVQDNIQWGEKNIFTIQPGIRYNYNTLNKQFLLSPRVSFSFQPKSWEKDIVFKGAVGIYDQPPFYREMLAYDGTINKELKAQKSIQASAGADYFFTIGQRPVKLVAEAYYKNMKDVDPYDIDNVRIRYYGNNNAKAYTYGAEMRLFADLVKDAESWFSIGYMKSMEKIDGLNYTQFLNASGEVITANTTDETPVATEEIPVGWLRRPTDRRVTVGMFFQDYLTTNKNNKVHLNMIYGSNLPYNVPGSAQYRNSLQIDPYVRVDIGFSTLLFDGMQPHRSHNPFAAFKNIWGSIEVFNLIDRSNIISYTLIKDYNNNLYPLPNRLTPRLLNFKVVVEW